MSFPLPPIIDNIVQVIKNPNVNLGEMYFNSLCITIFGASICILVSAMAGYYLARMKSKLSQGLYIYFLLGLMVPYAIVYVPLVSIFKGIGLIGNLPGLSLIHIYSQGNERYLRTLYHRQNHECSNRAGQGRFRG